MTHEYIGTKESLAWPQSENERPGYAVKYPDGYTSWSPKETFEAAYRVAEGPGQHLTFGDAVHFLKAGRRVARTGWNGKGMWLELQVPDEHSKMTLPYIYLNYPADAVNTPGARVPWLASQTDILAEDWVVLCDALMDIETALRRHLREVADYQKVAVWVNDEDRMMFTITNADGSQTEFVAVGDKLIPWPVKPPAQRVAAEGFDAHKGMGESLI